jgi:hypothetical protein
MSREDIMPKQPTAEEIATARALIARAAMKDADAPQAALIELVTMAEFDKVLEQMRKASTLNPANVDLSYTLSMMERIRASHAPV